MLHCTKTERLTDTQRAHYHVDTPQIDWRELLFAIRDATGWSDVAVSQKAAIGYGTIAALKNDAQRAANFNTGMKLLRMFLDVTDRDIPYCMVEQG